MISQLLAQRAADANPIRVGIIGTGKFGAGLVAQIFQMQGMEVAAIADINAHNARYAYGSSGVPTEEIRTAETGVELGRGDPRRQTGYCRGRPGPGRLRVCGCDRGGHRAAGCGRQTRLPCAKQTTSMW